MLIYNHTMEDEDNASNIIGESVSPRECMWKSEIVETL